MKLKRITLNTFTIILSITIFTVSIYSKRKSKKKQKTIAVLTFKDTSKSKKYEYLIESIPEAVITSIAKLKRFQVVERQAINAKLKEIETEAIGLNEDKAQSVAKILKADIYIIGSFLAIKQTVQINGRIFDANTGKLLGGAKVTGETSDKIFATLDDFSEKLSDSLDKAVPKETVVTKVVYKDRFVKIDESGSSFNPNLKIFIAPTFMMPLGFVKDGFDSGYGTNIKISYYDFLFKNFNIGINSGFNQLKASHTNMKSYYLIPIQGLLGYDIRLFNSFFMTPYGIGGIDMGKFEGKTQSVNYLVPSFGGGLQMSYYFWRGLGVYLDGSYAAQYDRVVNGFVNVSLGIGVKI